MQAIAAIMYYFAILTLVGFAFYYLDNWLDQDEATERATHAKHRAS